MLTVVTVEDKGRKSGERCLRDKLKINTLRVREASLGNLRVRHLRYINRRGRVNQRHIAKAIGNAVAVCSNAEALEAGGEVRLFSPEEFRGRLCENMGLAVLESMKTLPKELKIGIYDPKGESLSLCSHILKYTDSLVVVTGSVELYEAKAREIMWETGAILPISQRVRSLESCDLIIAPAELDRAFSPKGSAIVLTCKKPSVSLNCRVYYRYDFKLPPQLDSLRPEGLSSEYFGAALYSLEGVHSLGSLVPIVCRRGNTSETYLSLGRMIKGQREEIL